MFSFIIFVCLERSVFIYCCLILKINMLPSDILMKTKEKQRHKGSSLMLSMKLMDVQ